ncbi:hypothetical protein HZC32_02890 [Candidatus Woesearchaeota archaeon]|nr:hypothetical protein [Candidatus Woesearchaeota archaeon]
MYKKRWFTVKNRSAQITVFIIIGLLLLFAFLGVIYLAGNVKKIQLESEQSRIVAGSFGKEALRLYVEDCLKDELEKGLILLGTQGRIWGVQPGVKIKFEEGETGTTYNNDQVFYGIRNKLYPAYPNAYPCDDDSSPPKFCKYPASGVEVFGEFELSISSIKSDLRDYLINKTIWCVENFTKSNVSKSAKLQSTKLDLTLELYDDGINVQAEYPIKFKVGKEEFFQLSDFDFFYPTQFKQLLDFAVTHSLQKDFFDVNFKYTTEKLSSPDFSDYNFYKESDMKIDESRPSSGDDVFTFTPKLFTVLNSAQLYSYRIARQNRPPALNYVNRSDCPDSSYDYLVVPGDNSALGYIDINLSAIDPDEDELIYSFEKLPEGWKVSDESKPYSLFVPQGQLEQDVYTIIAKAADEHGLSDWQDVRILIDRPLTLTVGLRFPYLDIVSQQGDTNIISVEDPIFVDLTFPSKSDNVLNQNIYFKYNNDDNSESFTFQLPKGVFENSGCYSFPWTNEKNAPPCNLNNYNVNDIEDWTSKLNGGNFDYFKISGTLGTLNVSADATYCGNLDLAKSAVAKTYTVKCVPHRNPAHPFPYPYHKVTLNPDGTYGNENINPFEADHTCCIGDLDKPQSGHVADAGMECFVNKTRGCYGKIDKFTSLPNSGGYVLEEVFATCDGERGNTCLGNKRGRLPKDADGKELLVCGINNDNSCSNIAAECQNQSAWSSIPDSNGKVIGICHGKMGCGEFSKIGEIVLVTDVGLDKNNYYNINAKAKDYSTQALTDDLPAKIYDGCKGYDNLKCDANLDLYFKGTCKKGKCEGDTL